MGVPAASSKARFAEDAERSSLGAEPRFLLGAGGHEPVVKPNDPAGTLQESLLIGEDLAAHAASRRQRDFRVAESLEAGQEDLRDHTERYSRRQDAEKRFQPTQGLVELRSSQQSPRARRRVAAKGRSVGSDRRGNPSMPHLSSVRAPTRPELPKIEGGLPYRPHAFERPRTIVID